jgi:hypothetical protein
MDRDEGDGARVARSGGGRDARPFVVRRGFVEGAGERPAIRRVERRIVEPGDLVQGSGDGAQRPFVTGGVGK